MKKKHTAQAGFCNLRIITALFSVVVLAFLALFVATNPSTRGDTIRAAGVTRRAFMRVTPQGVFQSTDIGKSKGMAPAARVAQKPVLVPSGNTVWQYDDQTAIAGGVSIDANNVWGAWLLDGARLTMQAITGNGTPAWSFSSFGSGNSGVAAAKGADRRDSWSRTTWATTFCNMASGLPATAHRTGHSHIQSVIRICLPVPER